MKCGYCNMEGHNILTCTATECMNIVEKANECIQYDLSINDKAFIFYKDLMSLDYAFLKMSLARFNRNKYADSFYHSTNRRITTLSSHEIACHLVEDYFYRYVFQMYDLEYYCNLWSEIRLNQSLLPPPPSLNYQKKISEDTDNDNGRFTDEKIAKFTENELDALFMELTA